MKRKLFILSMAMLYAFSLSAQNEQQQINAIKRDMSFLYANGTSTASADEASENAKDLLALEIEQWLKENTQDSIAGYVAKSRECMSEIKTKRGNLYRVFVFVKKKDVLPYYKEENMMIVSLNDSVETKRDTIGLIRSNVDDQKAAVSTSSSTSAKVDEPSSIRHVPISTNAESGYVPSEREKLMLNIKTFSELNEYVNSGRADGSITQVGKYANLPQNEVVYVFIHNRQSEIPACIKMTGGKSINMKTGKEDVVSSYTGCGAIWIKIANE